MGQGSGGDQPKSDREDFDLIGGPDVLDLLLPHAPIVILIAVWAVQNSANYRFNGFLGRGGKAVA